MVSLNEVLRYESPPDATLMWKIGATSLGVAEALSELVANSVDARRYAEPLTVQIHYSTQEVSVLDDAQGMTPDTLAQALRLGVNMDAVLNRTEPRKGLFGIGMKAAAASLGDHWSVLTRHTDFPSDEFVFVADKGDYDRHSGEEAFRWEVEIERRPRALDGPLGERDSGTAIVVQELHQREAPAPGAVHAHLGRAFAPHIRAGDSIVVNGEQCQAPAWDLEMVDGTEFRENFEQRCGPNGAWVIHGWVGIRRYSSNKGEYGFSVYREDQLISHYDTTWFRTRHPMVSRVVGEAHVDFAPVNFSKIGWEVNSEQWASAREAMVPFLDKWLKASKELTRGRGVSIETKLARAAQGVERATKAAVESEAAVVGETEGDEALTGAEFPRAGFRIEHDVISFPNGDIKVTNMLGPLSSVETPWDYVYSEGELQVVINTNSTVFEELDDPEFLVKVAMADSVMQFLVLQRGVAAADAIVARNRWLHLIMGGRDE